MKKLVAKTTIGQEYLHSRQDAFFASTGADRIASALNKAGYKIGAGEKWHVYDYDCGMETYVFRRVFMSRTGAVKVADLY